MSKSKSTALESYTVQATGSQGLIYFRCTICGQASPGAECFNLADFIEFYWQHRCPPLTTN